MAITLEGGTSGIIAEVSPAGQLLVKMQTSAAEAGAMYLVGKSDVNSPTNTGSITGSTQGLLGTAVAVLEQEENFVGATLNTSKWKLQTATMTGAIVNNIAVLNSGTSVASGAYAILSSYRSIRAYRGCDRVVAWRVALEATPQTNNVVEIGVGLCATTASPTIAAIFRYGADGSFRGVIITTPGGSEVPTPDLISVMTTPTDFHDYTIVIGQDKVVFELDGLPIASLAIPVGSAAPMASESAPVYVRTYNTNTVSTAQKVSVARNVTACFGGLNGHDNKDISALCGDVGYQLVTGTGTGGPSNNYANNTVPPTLALSNTSPAATTLGGHGLITGPAASETDYILFGFQVPVGTVTNMGRTLIIYSVTVTMDLQSGTATNAALWDFKLGFGATAVSLATTETANTKTYRRVPIGTLNIAAGSPVGVNTAVLNLELAQPIAVNSGEYVALILRVPVGTTAGTPVYRLNFSVNASWE